MKKRIWKIWLALVVCLVIVAPVWARIITVEVTGVVEGVATHGGLALDGSVVIGSIMTGTTTYDTDTPDQHPNVLYGEYELISISMTVGNYTFTHDPMSSTSAFFEVHILSSNSYSYGLRSRDPRFDGTIYINGLPKTSEDLDWQYSGLHLMQLVYPDSIITDELPTSFPDISTFTRERYFGVGIDSPSEVPGFAIWGEITSLTVVPEPATTYYVDALNGDDDNDGLSPETAFATIQKSIDSAVNGDTILVAPGTYTGPGNRDIDFYGLAITVRSESGPENCIIDCNGSDANPHRGFYFHSDEDANSILAGFTITNGYGLKDRKFAGLMRSVGGAIFCDASSPTIANCIISGNSAERVGGGIYCEHSSPTITNCTISGNWVTWEWATGGGIYCWNASSDITNCIISSNSAGRGGGICCDHSSLMINHCIIGRIGNR